MSGNFETHLDMLVITPALGVTAGFCENTHCPITHWRVSLSWIFWTGSVEW